MAEGLNNADVWTVIEQLREHFGDRLRDHHDADQTDLLLEAADVVKSATQDELAQQLLALRPLLDRLVAIAVGRHKRRQDNDQAFVDMTEGIAGYLRKHGWVVLVMGHPGVEQALSARPMNFRFVIDFTGRRPVEAPPTIVIPGVTDGGVH